MSSVETQRRHYAIKRLQADKGTWYWFVKFSRRGEPYERRFYDPKHGEPMLLSRRRSSGGTACWRRSRCCV